MKSPTSLHQKPKVLIFRNELLPSSETFIKAQAAALTQFEPRFAGVHAALHSIHLPSSPILVDGTSNFIGKIKRRIFWRTGFATDFYRNLQERKPALIHAHFALDGAAALPMARKLNVPLLVTLHGYDITSSDSAHQSSVEGKLYLRRRSQLWANASLFLCISQFLYNTALSQGFPREKLRLHYTGTDLDHFTSGEVQRDPNMVLFVGRLVEKKGLPYLLEAFEAVLRIKPQAHIVAIGAGPLEEHLRNIAKSRKIPCTFLGSQPAEVVKQYMARARVFCAPSVTAATGDSEGLGMVFVEAQAMATPVASFRHGGIQEVVCHGETGLLAPEKDTASLAANLLVLLGDEDVWQHCSTNGPGWVRSMFSLTRQTAILESIYNEILRARH